MKAAAGLLRQWSSENPARLLQAALWQAERLSQMAPELEALRTQKRFLGAATVFWITMALMPLTTWLNANCAPR
jgi:hypothetical protein